MEERRGEEGRGEERRGGWRRGGVRRVDERRVEEKRGGWRRGGVRRVKGSSLVSIHGRRSSTEGERLRVILCWSGGTCCSLPPHHR